MNPMTEPDVPAVQPFGPLRRSARMPVLFLGHGSPMNVIEDNEYRRSWQALAASATYPVHFRPLVDARLVADRDGKAQNHP